jgi:hypothetical protein
LFHEWHEQYNTIYFYFFCIFLLGCSYLIDMFFSNDMESEKMNICTFRNTYAKFFLFGMQVDGYHTKKIPNLSQI